MNQEEEMALSSGTFPELSLLIWDKKSIHKMSKPKIPFYGVTQMYLKVTDVIKRWWFKTKEGEQSIGGPFTPFFSFMQTCVVGKLIKASCLTKHKRIKKT